MYFDEQYYLNVHKLTGFNKYLNTLNISYYEQMLMTCRLIVHYLTAMTVILMPWFQQGSPKVMYPKQPPIINIKISDKAKPSVTKANKHHHEYKQCLQIYIKPDKPLYPLHTVTSQDAVMSPGCCHSALINSHPSVYTDPLM